MPNTPDHKVEMHQLARARVAAGLPVWDRKLRLGDIFHNEAMSFEQRRDAIVQRIRDSGWLAAREADSDKFDNLPLLVEELADTTCNEEFNAVWDEIYDIADYDRVWIETVSR